MRRLRAGMPIAVIAQICSRSRIVRPIPLHAIGGSVLVTGPRHDGYRATIVIIPVIIAGIRGVVAGAAIIALRRDRASDHRAGDARGHAGTEAATMVMIAAA